MSHNSPDRTPLRYRTIVADPPWEYPSKFARRWEPGEGTVRDALPYPSMTVDEIAALPVSTLAADDAWLFLWTTNKYLRAAFDVVDAWGFTYGQTVVWDKGVPSTPFPALVAPNFAEYLLACRRGKVTRRLGRASTWPTNIVRGPRSEHSRKPDVFMDMVEHVAPAPYLELFSRRARLGWDTWGNEALHSNPSMQGLEP